LVILGRPTVAAVLGCVIFCLAGDAVADEPKPPRDVDAWHEALREAIGAPICNPPERRWSLGLYPSLGLALGPPEWLSYQIHGYVSLSDGNRFSLFTGYGFERGYGSESHMVTVGWGGVRRLAGSRPQRGFYGKFLRYRRMNDDSHGILHGLSVGAESGAGPFGLAFEIGAARSANNHWSFTAQVGLKVALPVFIPLSHSAEPRPGS
jgi:hypothetical protein